MTNAQKYTTLAEQEIAKYHTLHAEARKRHEEAVEADATDERYFDNAFYVDESQDHLMLAKIYAQLATVPEQIVVGEVPFEEAAQTPEAPSPTDPVASLTNFLGALPSIITLIQTSSRPRG